MVVNNELCARYVVPGGSEYCERHNNVLYRWFLYLTRMICTPILGVRRFFSISGLVASTCPYS